MNTSSRPNLTLNGPARVNNRRATADSATDPKTVPMTLGIRVLSRIGSLQNVAVAFVAAGAVYESPIS